MCVSGCRGDRRRRSRGRQSRIGDVEQPHLAFAEFVRDRRHRDRGHIDATRRVLQVEGKQRFSERESAPSLKLMMQSMLDQQRGSRAAPARDQIVASFGRSRLRA